MRTITATFTESEVIAIRDALSEETTRMRRHVANMDRELDQPDTPIIYEQTIGARKVLKELESLLTWAKEKSAARF